MKCFRFPWHLPPEPTVPSTLGQLREPKPGAGRRQEDVGWGWKARRAGETVLDSGGRTEPPDPAHLQPRSREPLPKELHALLLRLYGDPRAGTFTQYKKGAKKPKQVVNFSSPSRGEVFSL